MKEIAAKVREAGVVGAGGAGFPTHVKLDAQAEIVIVNGAECEPLLRTDQQLAAEKPELLVSGLAHAMNATGAREGIIALKGKYKAAIKALKPLLSSKMRIEILPDIYPAGDEVVTIWLTTGRRVPPGGIPIDIGVVVNNVQTLMNVARAQNGQAVTTRTLTVTGDVPNPVTVTVPVGTRMREVLALAGAEEDGRHAYIDGGPVMGSLLDDLDKPVIKTSGGIIVLPEDHPLVRKKQQDKSSILRQAKTVCEQCSLCTELCPRHIIGHKLQPHLIVRATSYNYIGNPEALTAAMICSECGVCEVYACPVGISPRRINAALKAEMRAQGIRYRGEIGKEDIIGRERLVPTHRLHERMKLMQWYQDAPLQEGVYEPEEVEIRLQQHIGAPAIPVVKAGDQVKQGMLVGEIPEGKLGARVHASIDGVVVEVTTQAIKIKKGGVKND